MPLLLTAAESRAADQAAADAGTPFATLIERAGAAVADAIRARFAPRATCVLCGPGDNGGDGRVVARLLKESGWPITTPALEEAPAALAHAELIVDALFGTGLSRAPEGAAAAAIVAANARGVPIVSIDIPSGVNADTGEAYAPAICAQLTVSFIAAKRGHYLLPGRMHTGELAVADIGAPAVSASAFLNHPSQWQHALPVPTLADHKYTRGHTLILSGPAHSTGAAKLAAMAAARAGSGLTSIACTEAALPMIAPALLSIMTKRVETPRDLAKLLPEARVRAAVIGPGCGADARLRDMLEVLLAANIPLVIDADALTVLAAHRKTLLPKLHAACVLTPHEGEFARLFRAHAGDAITRAEAAAHETGAVVLLKGASTVISAPGTPSVVNAHAPAWLATAGAGDVLAGIIGGLLAQGMAPHTAAIAAAWLHGETGCMARSHCIAEDVVEWLPRIFQQILGKYSD